MEETVLICLPFAGAGASFFTPWQGQAPAGLTILPVQLPGREKRFAEPAYASAAEAVDDAYAQVTAVLGGTGRRAAVFGHSMGAVLAYELAHRLEREPGIRLEALFVSGSAGPWTARSDRAGGLPENEFVARVRSFAGYAHPALENPEMRELLLPSLRADVQLHESYRPASERPLAVRVVSVRGRTDTLVGAAGAAEWGSATNGKLTVAELDGGHMYLADRPGALLELIATELGEG
ncbi:thioesterase II family protein [Streptomyces sp. NPDC005262]|uniref:thioesterase II family protein n=1 Tax=Streptomyces sp. NPDC005262 TaxID=3364710 RepID=UPI00369FD022